MNFEESGELDAEGFGFFGSLSGSLSWSGEDPFLPAPAPLDPSAIISTSLTQAGNQQPGEAPTPFSVATVPTWDSWSPTSAPSPNSDSSLSSPSPSHFPTPPKEDESRLGFQVPVSPTTPATPVSPAPASPATPVYTPTTPVFAPSTPAPASPVVSPAPATKPSPPTRARRNTKGGKQQQATNDSCEAKDTRKRKRRKYIRQEEVKPTTVTLPRQRLLTMTLVEMDDYIKETKSSKRLTEEEDQDLKRQRRLVKNRESALASRNRKKEDMEQLEDEVNQLKEANRSQREQIARLESENVYLKREVRELNNLLHGSPYFSAESLGSVMGSLSSYDIGQASPKVAGVTVMILLLSFGAFLGPLSQGGFTSGSPFHSMMSPSMTSPPLSIEQQPEDFVSRSSSQGPWKHRDILGAKAGAAGCSTSPHPTANIEISRPQPIGEVLGGECEPSVIDCSETQTGERVEMTSELRSYVEGNANATEACSESAHADDSVVIQMVVPRSMLQNAIPPSDVDSDLTVPPVPSSSSSSTPSSSSSTPSSSSSTSSSSSPTSSSTQATPLPLPDVSNHVEMTCRLLNLNLSSRSHAFPKVENLKS